MKHLKTSLFPILILCLIGLPKSVFAQNNYRRFTYFGAEIGTKSELYQVTDNGNELNSRRSFSRGLSGIVLEQELNRYFSVGTGIYFSRYGIDFGFRRDAGRFDFPAMKTTMLPLRIQATIPIYYGIPELRIKPEAGLVAVLNHSFFRDSIYGKIAPVLSDQYTGTMRYDFKQFYWLGEVGLNLEMLFAKGLIASLNARYQKGLTTVAQTSVNYRIDRKNYSGTLSSSGDFFNIGLSVRYPISRWWNTRSRKK